MMLPVLSLISLFVQTVGTELGTMASKEPLSLSSSSSSPSSLSLLRCCVLLLQGNDLIQQGRMPGQITSTPGNGTS